MCLEGGVQAMSERVRANLDSTLEGSAARAGKQVVYADHDVDAFPPQYILKCVCVRTCVYVCVRERGEGQSVQAR